MPDGQYIPDWSVIHEQKRQDGFFKHPILVIGTTALRFAHFYALTKEPPHAIKDLGMCLRIGDTTADEGEGVLKLAGNSEHMQRTTWINLEQLFFIEWDFLDYWLANVEIDASEWSKLDSKVIELEARQNRYIYKPLTPNFKDITPGTVIMLKNPPGSGTVGSPVLVLENDYPRFRFLRVKALTEVAKIVDPNGEVELTKARRRRCLEICRIPKDGHDNTPVLLYEEGSPEMREPSYVEANKRARWSRFNQCKTWCVPPVRLSDAAMQVLWKYLENLPDLDDGNNTAWKCKNSTHPPIYSKQNHMKQQTTPASGQNRVQDPRAKTHPALNNTDQENQGTTSRIHPYGSHASTYPAGNQMGSANQYHVGPNHVCGVPTPAYAPYNQHGHGRTPLAPIAPNTPPQPHTPNFHQMPNPNQHQTWGSGYPQGMVYQRNMFNQPPTAYRGYPPQNTGHTWYMQSAQPNSSPYPCPGPIYARKFPCSMTRYAPGGNRYQGLTQPGFVPPYQGSGVPPGLPPTPNRDPRYWRFPPN